MVHKLKFKFGHGVGGDISMLVTSMLDIDYVGVLDVINMIKLSPTCFFIGLAV